MSDHPETPEWLPERLERARRGAIQEWAQEQGFADPDALREAIATLPTLVAERDAARQDAENSQTALLNAAFWLEASRYDFINVEDARRLIDLSGVEIGADGRVEGMQQAVTALVDTRPYLLHKRKPATLDSRTQSTPPPNGDLPAEQIAAIKQRFKL